MSSEKFSDRVGLGRSREVLQLSSMDQELRVKIWNLVFRIMGGYTTQHATWSFSTIPEIQWAREIWEQELRRPVDDFPDSGADLQRQFKNLILKGEWNRVYDLLEYMLASRRNPKWFRAGIETTLRDELSGYRLLRGKFVPIVDKYQLTAVEKSRSEAEAQGFGLVAKHLDNAVALMSNRKKPDHHNSIKESISAVEAIVQHITGGKGNGVEKALRTLEGAGKIHPSLRKAFTLLYGYASDEDGIRHGMMEPNTVGPRESRFMLVACSAFVSYLLDSPT